MPHLRRIATLLAAAVTLAGSLAAQAVPADSAIRRQQRTLDSLVAALRTLQARIDSLERAQARGDTTGDDELAALRAAAGAVSVDSAAAAAPPRQARLGQNAMNPFMADLCGQDYRTMTGACDFVQPLLGYMRWHVMEPVLAWRDWLRSRVAGLGGREALTVAKRLLGLGDVDWPEDDPERLHGEGPASLIRQTTHAALRRVVAWQSESLAVTPVLQGQDWPPDLTHEMSEYAESIGVAGVVYQGCKNLLPLSPPDDGWR